MAMADGGMMKRLEMMSVIRVLKVSKVVMSTEVIKWS